MSEQFSDFFCSLLGFLCSCSGESLGNVLNQENPVPLRLTGPIFVFKQPRTAAAAVKDSEVKIRDVCCAHRNYGVNYKWVLIRDNTKEKETFTTKTPASWSHYNSLLSKHLSLSRSNACYLHRSRCKHARSPVGML